VGLFSIDIDKYYQEEAEKGEQVLGIFCLQYPIYCIHANITDMTPDPLDSLDKIIAEFIQVKADFDSLQIGTLIGTSKALIDNRLQALLDDGLIEKKPSGWYLTGTGSAIFSKSEQTRTHKRSYDFYLDGISLSTLPAVFYKQYRFKFISEHDSYYRTNKKGEEILVYPFGPDIIHTPPNKDIIAQNIFMKKKDERELFEIPIGLQNIDEISFTKLSFQIFVSVTKKDSLLSKKLIDPFAWYSMQDNIPYIDCLRKNVTDFEKHLYENIQNLEFKLVALPQQDLAINERKVFLSSNWSEIGNKKYSESANKCFSFTQDDLVEAVKSLYGIKYLTVESLDYSETKLAIKVTKQILLEASNRFKLINDLIRSRDYKFGNPDNNVYLLYIHYTTNDPYVEQVVRFKQLLEIAKENNEISERWLKNQQKDFGISYRELLVASGELDVLEKIDIDTHMLKLH
jgi:hypothetical protein